MSASTHHDTVVEILNKKLVPGDQFRLRVTSRSMMPLLEPNDFILVETCTQNQIHRGDLITIRRHNDIVTHRLVNIGQNTVLTKGDHSPLPDAPVKSKDVLGRVNKIERGTFSLNLRSPKWTISNRLLGAVGWLEMILFRIVSKIIPSIYNPGNKFIKGLTRLFVAPFRIMNWVIVKSMSQLQD